MYDISVQLTSGAATEVVRQISHSRLGDVRVVPGDGDLLLRQAIVVDFCLEQVNDGVCMYATLLSGSGREFYEFRDNVVRKLERRFQAIAQEDRSRVAAGHFKGRALQPTLPA